MKSLFLSIAAVLLCSTSIPEMMPASETGELSLQINGGSIKQVRGPANTEGNSIVLYWQPDGGTPVVIHQEGGSDLQWTLSAGYFGGDRIALWRGNAPGMTEYWGFTCKDGKWQLTDRAQLGGILGLNFDNVRFSSARTLEFLNGKRVTSIFEITEEPRGGDPLYRKVLRNGIEWSPSGTHVGNEVQKLMKPPISLKIRGGTIKEVRTHADAETYMATLSWEPDGGAPVVLDQSEHSSKRDPNWTLHTGYFDGNKIALWRVSALNSTEYWGFTQKEGKWQLTDRAMLESITFLNFDKAEFSSSRVLELSKDKRVLTKFEVTEESRGGHPLYRKVLRNEIEWSPHGTVVGTESLSLMNAQAQKQDAEPDASRASSDPAPPVRVTDFAKMNEGELVQALKRGDLSRYQAIVKTDDPADLRLIFRVYSAAKKEGIYWNKALWLLSQSPQTWVAEEIWNDFVQAPSITILPNAELGWGKTAELIQEPKYVLATAVVRIGDAEMTTRLWQQFRTMSPEDQMVVAMVADVAPRLAAAQAILKAVESAKTDKIAEQLVDSANRLVAQALEDPAKRDGATGVARYLSSKGLAREFLLEKMK
jgi:hypothetical protein